MKPCKRCEGMEYPCALLAGLCPYCQAKDRDELAAAREALRLCKAFLDRKLPPQMDEDTVLTIVNAALAKGDKR